ncbi:MAG: endonuclease, partial [Alistipes sp.]|nr:endonuclease [Alistipes sp.]
MKRFFLCALMATFAFTALAQELNVGSVNVRFLTPRDNKKHNGWDERKGYLCDMINLEAFDVFG